MPPGAVVPSFLAGSLPVGTAAAGIGNPALAATPNPTPAPTPIPEPVYGTSCVLNLAGNFQGGMPGIITSQIAISCLRATPTVTVSGVAAGASTTATLALLIDTQRNKACTPVPSQLHISAELLVHVDRFHEMVVHVTKRST